MNQLNNVVANSAPIAPSQSQIDFDNWVATKGTDMITYFTKFIESRVLSLLQAKIDARDATKNPSIWVYTLNVAITSEEATTFEDCYCSQFRKQKWIVENYNLQYPDSLTQLAGYSIKRTKSDDVPAIELITLNMRFTTPPQ